MGKFVLKSKDSLIRPHSGYGSAILVSSREGWRGIKNQISLDLQSHSIAQKNPTKINTIRT